MTRPDFIIIGAMKSGTSTLADQLSRQTDVFLTSPKEPNFFSDDDVFARGFGWYDALFETAKPGDLLGEASTHYTKLPTYPKTVARLKEHCPDTKLVYIIRNPVERAISHFIHEWSQGNFSDNVAAALETTPVLVDYGRYAYQIAPFVGAFGADRIFLTSLELMKSDPPEVCRQLSAFLDRKITWNSDLGASNVSAERIRQFPLRRLLIDAPLMQGLRRTHVPKSLRDWVRGRLTYKNRPELPAETRASLETIFLQDRNALAKIFPGHAALDLCYPFAP